LTPAGAIAFEYFPPMVDIASVSRTDLVQRRRQLRRQRRWRLFQSVWRTGCVLGFAGGLLWVTTQPIWVLHHADQVIVEGNELLSVDVIQSLLPLEYPQSLLRLDPQAIAHHLEAQGPIEAATVTRQVLPPGLKVMIQERRPVAILVRGSGAIDQGMAIDRDRSTQVGLIDEKGFWMSLSAYVALDNSLLLPDLKVLGMQEHQRHQWVTLFQALNEAPFITTDVDWRNPANLILKTELGTVHVGPYGPRFPQQLQALDQMREFHQTLDVTRLDYIDLRNPDAPLVVEISPVRSPAPHETPP
jgi:cell division protein FtsQ